MKSSSYTDPLDRWWPTLPPDELGPAVYAQFRRYIDEMQRRNRLARIREADAAYYAEVPTIDFGGEQGEWVLAKVNHFRSLVTGVLAMTTAQRPAFEVSAADDSSESSAHVELSQQILDFHLDTGLEGHLTQGAWRELVHGETALAVLWDAAGGDIVGAQPPVVDEMGQQLAPETPIYRGELMIETYSPYDVARDMAARSLDGLPWVILRRRMSRWDLAEKYPEAREEIIGAKGSYDDDWSLGMQMDDAAAAPYQTDQIYVYELYVDRCAAAPNGVYARVVAEKYLEGGDLPYKRLPVIVKSPDAKRDQAVGSTQVWDLLAGQAMIDAAESAMASVADAYGKGNILCAEGHDLDVSDLGGGMQKVVYQPMPDAPPPMPMVMPRVDSADIEYVKHLQSTMQVLIGLNDTVRGDPGSNLKAGVSLAMMQAVAVQYMSRFQSSYAQLVREAGALIIETYQQFASVERVIEVSGTDQTRSATTFTKHDISKARTVRVELGNALMRTMAGKLELAQQLIDPAKFPADQPMSREQYIEFLTTGRLKPLYRADQSSAVAIRSECEALAKGEPVEVLMTDRHPSHIREHVAMLDGRQRMQLPPDRIAAISEHIAEHVAQWVQLTVTNPVLLAALGIPPAPMMQPPPGPEGAPAGPGGPPPGPPPPGAPQDAGNPAPSPIPGAGVSPGQLPGLPDQPNGAPTPIQGSMQ